MDFAELIKDRRVRIGIGAVIILGIVTIIARRKSRSKMATVHQIKPVASTTLPASTAPRVVTTEAPTPSTNFVTEIIGNLNPSGV